MIYRFFLLFILFFAVTVSPARANMNDEVYTRVDHVYVMKSEGKMYLTYKGKVVREYKIDLGPQPVGHKVQEGDGRTPEGLYTLDYKNDQSKFYKSIAISYPNEEDVKRAKQMGVSPGGGIVIHGARNGKGWSNINQKKNWTQGCIAVRNPDMDEIWRLVEVDTPIEILP